MGTLEEQKNQFLGCIVSLNMKNGENIKGTILDVKQSCDNVSGTTDLPDPRKIRLRLGKVSIDERCITSILEIKPEYIQSLQVIKANDFWPSSVQQSGSSGDVSQNLTKNLSERKKGGRNTPKLHGSVDVESKSMETTKVDLDLKTTTTHKKMNKVESSKCLEVVMDNFVNLNIQEDNKKSPNKNNVLNTTDDPQSPSCFDESAIVSLVSPPSTSDAFPSSSLEGPFTCKYYNMTDKTKKEFWLRKPVPPPKPNIYPVGHPNNKTGVQNVWTAAPHEIEYFVQQKCFVPTIPMENLIVTEECYQDRMRPNMVLCGKFVFQSPDHKHKEIIEAMPLESKIIFLKDLAFSFVGETGFWIRTQESFGHSLFHIAMSFAGLSRKKKWNSPIPRVLICAGSNLQGSACLVAARYFNLYGAEVFLYCLKRTDEKEQPFPGADLGIEGLRFLKGHIFYKRSELRGIKFHLVLLGMDDHTAPNATLYLYKEWIKKTPVVLVDPPVIGQSYSSLIEKICYGYNTSNGTVKVPACIVYCFRPSPCTFDEESDTFVVNIATTTLYPPIGNHYWARINKLVNIKPLTNPLPQILSSLISSSKSNK